MKQKFVYWIVNNEKKKFKAGLFTYDIRTFDRHYCSLLNICCEHEDHKVELDTDGYTMFIDSNPNTKGVALNQVCQLYRVFESLGYIPDNDIAIYKRSHKQGKKTIKRTQKDCGMYPSFQFPLSELNDSVYLQLSSMDQGSIVIWDTDESK